MDNENNRSNEFKFIFSSVSLLLMIPPLVGGEQDYYRTLFIFLINRIIDLIFASKKNTSFFLSTWDFLNRCAGLWACAFSFCLMTTAFMDIFDGDYMIILHIINIILFVVSLSYVLKEFIEMFYVPKKTKSLLAEITASYNMTEQSENSVNTVHTSLSKLE